MICIPTQNSFYTDEATALLSEISMYPGILEEQILRLHPQNEEQIINLLRHLQRQGRIKRDYRNSYYSTSTTLKVEREAVIRRIWVLLTFPTNMLLDLGIMLAAGEVPKIAQQFGLETSAKFNIMNVVHTASTAVSVGKLVASAK